MCFIGVLGFVAICLWLKKMSKLAENEKKFQDKFKGE